jgi:hypothetical protein
MSKRIRQDACAAAAAEGRQAAKGRRARCARHLPGSGWHEA